MEPRSHETRTKHITYWFMSANLPTQKSQSKARKKTMNNQPIVYFRIRMGITDLNLKFQSQNCNEFTTHAYWVFLSRWNHLCSVAQKKLWNSDQPTLLNKVAARILVSSKPTVSLWLDTASNFDNIGNKTWSKQKPARQNTTILMLM